MHQTFALLNSGTLDAIPPALAKPRGNATARVLSTADWLIRRKRDGRYLATASFSSRIVELQRNALSPRDKNDVDELFDNATRDVQQRPLDGLDRWLDQLHIDTAEYAQRTGLVLTAEPSRLAFAGFDRYRRPLWLTQEAARSWSRMQQAAQWQGVTLDAISGYRSHAYQLGIFERKLALGQKLTDILKVNAAPGFSEHHSGCALDIGTPGDPAAEESFERTAAFEWLKHHAGDFGFYLSYPRDNPNGIVYEPWHWCWRPQAKR